MDYKYNFYLSRNMPFVNEVYIYLLSFIKEQGIESYEDNHSFNLHILSIYTSNKNFHLISEYLMQSFALDVDDFVIIDYKHYHIERYDQNDKLIHEATAYLVEDKYWEFYYEDGIFTNLILNEKGSIKELNGYIFGKKINNILVKSIEREFDIWLINFKD